MDRQKDWFKIKKYPHIGRPLMAKDRMWVSNYVGNKNKIAEHAFYPFIHRTTLTRKFRKSVDPLTGKRSQTRISALKPRDLYYANHLDSCVYSYYAMLLNVSYEQKLSDYRLSDVVTAYRRIKVNPTNVKSSHKSSADFAADVFNYILSSNEEELIAITFDIKGFFDNLDHKKLKSSWCRVISENTLKEDEYNVFKNITKFSYVNENQLFNEFKNEILTQTKTGIERKRKIKRIHHLRNQGAVAFCELEDIKRIRTKRLLVGNGNSKFPLRTKGIPQGSPISAVLANVYMLDFDRKINDLITSFSGIYRRYSDDMIVICDEKYQQKVIETFDEYISERLLEVQHDKTQIFKFYRDSNRYKCLQRLGTVLNPNKNLEYLGFEFDGFNTFLKSSSLSSFYRKMKRSYTRSLYYSKTLKSSKSLGLLFKTRLYKKFSYKGAGRRKIYIQDKTNPAKFIETNRYNWGNYISYAQLAINKLPNNKIKGQIKRHWKILNKLININK